MPRTNEFAFKIATANGTGSASANGLIMQAIFRMGIPVTGKNVFPVEHPGAADVVRDPRRQARLHGADADVRPDGGAQPRDLSEGCPGGPVRRLAVLRLDLAARPASDAAGCDLPRDSARRAVQHAVQGTARAHPDEEHRLCRGAGRAPRHGHRDHPRAPDREVLAQAGADGLEPASRRPRLRLCARALRLSAAHQARGDGQDEGLDPHRRQHRRRGSAASTPARRSARGIRSRRRRR